MARRALRWLGIGLGAGLGVLGALTAGSLLWITSDSGNDFVRRLAIEKAAPLLNGSLRLGHLSFDLLHHLRAEGFAVCDAHGREVIGFETLDLRYDLGGVFARRFQIDALTLKAPVVDLQTGPDGALNLSTLLGLTPSTTPSTPWGGLAGRLELDALHIEHGRFSYATPGGTTSLTDLDLDAAAVVQGGSVQVDGLRISAELQGPAPRAITVAGSAALTDGDLSVSALRAQLGNTALIAQGTVGAVQTDPSLALSVELALCKTDLDAALADLGGVAPGSPPLLRSNLGLSATVRGGARDLAAVVVMDGEPGRLSVEGQADLEASPITWRASADTAGFDLARLLGPVTERTRLVGHYAVQGTGSSWPASETEIGPDTVAATLTITGGDQVLWGQPVRDLRLEAVLSKGQLSVRRLNGRHAAGTVALSGSVDLNKGRAALHGAVGLPDLRVLSAYGVIGVGGDARYEGGAAVDWSGPELVVDADGTLSAGALSGPSALAVAGVTAPLHLHLRGNSLSAHGDLAAASIAASGATLGATHASWELTRSAAGATDLHVAGLRAEKLTAPGEVATMLSLSGDASVHLDRKGTASGTVALEVEQVRLQNGQQGSGPISLALDGDAVRGKIALHDEDGGPVFFGDATGDLGSGAWTITGLQVAPTLGMLWTASAPVQFTVADDGLRDLSLSLSSAAGQISASGDARLGTPDLKLAISGLDLAWVGAVKAEFSPPTEEDPLAGLGGHLTANLSVGPGATAPTMAGTLAITDFALPSTLASPMDLSLSLREADQTATVEGTVTRDTAPWVALGADVPLRFDLAKGDLGLRCDGTMAARAILGPLSSAEIRHVLPAEADVADAVSLDLSATGSPCDPDVHIVGALNHKMPDTGQIVRLDIDTRRRASDLALSASVETDLTRRLSVEGAAHTGLSQVMNWAFADGPEPDWGRPSTWLSDLDINATPLEVPVDELASLAGSTAPVRGRLVGGVHLGGNLEAPDVSAGLQLVDGAIGEEPLNLGVLTLVPATDGYNLLADLGFVHGGGLKLEGFVPFHLGLGADASPALGGALGREGLDLKFSGPGLPLAMLSGGTSGISDATGLLQITGDVTGTILDPKLALRLFMEGGGLSLAANDVHYEDVGLDAELTSSRLKILSASSKTRTRFASTLRPGHLTLSGLVDLDAFAPQKVALDANMDAFLAVATPSTMIATSGQLKLTGRWPDLTVSGALTLDDGRIVVTRDAFLNNASLLLSPDLAIYRPSQTEAGTYRGQRPALWEDFDLNLKADLASHLRLVIEVPTADSYGSQFADLSTVKLDASFDGDMDISGKAGAPILLGEVETANNRGKVTVLNATFALEQGGTLNFIGNDYSNPIVDLSANRDVGQYGTVTVSIAGHASDLKVTPTSDLYPDPSDALSLLLFGKPAKDLTDTEGQAGAVLLGVALSSLSGRVEQVVGLNALDQFEIDPATNAVRVGKALSDNLFLSLQVMPQTDVTENVAQATVDWLIGRQVYAAFVTGDRGRSSADLYWRWRF